MGTTPTVIIFYLLAVLMVFSSIVAVTTKSMLRAATFLLFVLLGTAGIYLLLNYHFLAGAQAAVYAGGVLVLIIFAVLLTSAKGERLRRADRKRMLFSGLLSIAGAAVTLLIIFKHKMLYTTDPIAMGDQEINMKEIGNALLGTGKYEYLLSFEALSILLLASLIGGILIARKR